MKECLRHGVDPFIVDDKHRGAYHRGITAWNKDLQFLTSVCLKAQKHFHEKLEVCKLMQYHRPPISFKEV